MTDAERLQAFLSELAALTVKYDLEIGGCGECGSAWVTDLTSGKDVVKQLTYNPVRKIYTSWEDREQPWPHPSVVDTGKT